MTFAALAAVLLMATSPTQPEDIATLQGELRSHSEAAKTEGRAGMQALSAGDMDGAWIATQGQVQGAIAKHCKG